MNQMLIRGSLLDTALVVSALSFGAQPEHSVSWYEYCKNLVIQLKQSLAEGDYAESEIEQISYAQCALLDEAALKFLKGADRDVWEMEPLQVHFFQTYNAGDVLCNRIEELSKSPSPNPRLAEAYLSIMNLGFRGRYVLDEAEADRWREQLAKFVPVELSVDKTSDGYFFFIDKKGTPIKNSIRVNPTWVFIGCTFFAVCVYLIFNYYLDNLAQSLQIKA
ncbi:DotU/TssL family secretion system protein [Neisseria canis]|uniref:Uncharacterized protein conserved in bacteria n=1 Tax=Neisseria canis TaxID=493 RepID=A0A448D752_9NEIS|nr:DotU/TssL family secretion system protein [Neisseria canis]OSI09238.1 type IV secretion protein DotU [Neisseria canis]VEF00479.1 Uncharacterized protein conserved in bacteria [Neisseria canis]